MIDFLSHPSNWVVAGEAPVTEETLTLHHQVKELLGGGTLDRISFLCHIIRACKYKISLNT